MKDAFEEVITEPQAKLKYFVFAIPLFIAFYLYTKEMVGFWFYFCVAVSALEILGIMVRTANNVMNFRDFLLPTFNIFTLFGDAIRTIFAIIPALLLNGGITYYLVTKIYPMITVVWVQKGAEYITYAVVGSIIITVFLLYAKKFRFKDTFDLKAISDSCIDVMVQLIWMTFLAIVANVFTIGLITYLGYVFIGLENFVILYAWSMSAIFNAALIGNYLGQLNYEALHQVRIEDEEEYEKMHFENAPTSQYAEQQRYSSSKARAQARRKQHYQPKHDTSASVNEDGSFKHPNQW